MKKHGIFIKVFTYTVIAILLLVSVMAVLFSGQFMLLYRTLQNRQIVASYEPLVRRIRTSNNNDICHIELIHQTIWIKYQAAMDLH